MNIDELTIGQAKELAAMFQHQDATPKSPNLFSYLIGKYVIVRSRNEGVNAGKVIEAGKTGIHLKDARRIWYHKPADKSLAWYEGVAQSGLSSDSKISCESEKVIAEDWSATVCSYDAEVSIRKAKSHGQN